MNKAWMNAGLVCLAVGLCSGRAAAQLRELSSTQDGTGTLSFMTRSSGADVRRAQVNLRSNGSAEIRAISGADETFFGRWSNNGNRSCRITIERAGRDPASGSGQVDHDGRGRFTRIDLSGNISGTRFEFKFTPSASGGGGVSEINSTRDGAGMLHFRTRSSASDIHRVSVALQRAGDFEVRVLSGANESWRGKWRQESGSRARLDVHRLGNSAATGSGYVDVDGRGSFDRVHLSGSGGGATFTLDFRAGSGSNLRPPWTGSVQDAAQWAVTNEIRRRHGGSVNVTFLSTRTSLLSLTERTVTGQVRMIAESGRPGRTFTYSVKVNTRTGETRDVEVR